jgi:hypothetical protein
MLLEAGRKHMNHERPRQLHTYVYLHIMDAFYYFLCIKLFIIINVCFYLPFLRFNGRNLIFIFEISKVSTDNLFTSSAINGHGQTI